jgi:hypothetical protein
VPRRALRENTPLPDEPESRTVSAVAARPALSERERKPSLADFSPLSRNPNKHTPRGMALLEDAIHRDGYVAPMTATADGTIIDGNARLETVATALSSEPIIVNHDGTRPIIAVRTDIPNADDPRAKRIAVAANRIGAVDLEWDTAILSELANEIDLSGLFKDDELAELLGNEPEAGLTDPDAVPEERPTDIKLGDLFSLGDHRLLCGDSTKAEDVARVMGGEKADLCLTDPPYGVGENYASHNDTKQNLALLIAGFLPLAREHARVVMLTPGNKNQRLYPAPDWTLCWFVEAGTGRGPWGFTCWQPIIAFGKDPYLAEGLGSRPDGLAKTEAADNSLGHPCPKPVGVWSWFVERGTVRTGTVIFDPFCGGGTTLIACEQLSRKCYAIEIEPKYVQVAIDRWEAFTGRKAEKVAEAVAA